MIKPLTEVREDFYYYQRGEDRALQLVYARTNGTLVHIKPVSGRGGFENIPLTRALESLRPATEMDVRRELKIMEESYRTFSHLCDKRYSRGRATQEEELQGPRPLSRDERGMVVKR